MTGPELRHLPRSQTRWERDADVVVVGSGAAGMTAALTAARHGRRVLLLSKEDIGGGATPLAQGGLAAAIGPGDTRPCTSGTRSTRAPACCDPAAVATLASEAPGEIARLAGRGARLERTALHLEGGHSRKRIVNAGGDAIGAEVHRVLRAALLASPVQILTRCVALDALTDDRGSVGGVLAGMPGDDGALRAGTVTARAVVLATGGFGQAYATTTNPAGLTGDGLALAARAGAELRDVEFVQFHPTVLWQEAARGQCPLITEALRGAGAVLVDAAGQPVMAGRHPLGDLAPRDVVSSAMQQRMGRGDGPARSSLAGRHRAGPGRAGAGFPHRDRPVPGAGDRPGHRADPGRARRALRLRRHPGRHGRPDLGPRALRRRGSRVDRGARRQPPRVQLPDRGPDHRPARRGPARPGPARAIGPPAAAARGARAWTRPPGRPWPRPCPGTPGCCAIARAWNACGRRWGRPRPRAAGWTWPRVEATSLHAVSVLVAVAALARTESRGCHRWRDAPPARLGRPGPAHRAARG